MASVCCEYAPSDKAETFHFKISMKLPSKWLQPERGTRVKRVLDAFAKSYNGKFGAGKMDGETLHLVDPVTAKDIFADGLVTDLAGRAGKTFIVVSGRKAVDAAAAAVARAAPPPKAVAPVAAAPKNPAQDPANDPRNTSGQYRTGKRALQQDQPTVAEHVGKPKTKIYRYRLIEPKGVPYHAGPFDEDSLGADPPRAHLGAVFEGLLDEASPGRIRVIREATGAHDGYWICRIWSGRECVERVDDRARLEGGRAPAPPPPPQPKKEIDPAIAAAWANYAEHGVPPTDDAATSAAEKEWRAAQTQEAGASEWKRE